MYQAITLVKDKYLLSELGRELTFMSDVYEPMTRQDGTLCNVRVGRERRTELLNENHYLGRELMSIDEITMNWDNKTYTFLFQKNFGTYDSHICQAIDYLSGHEYDPLILDNEIDGEMHENYPRVADFSIFPFLELICRGVGKSYWRIVNPRRALTCPWEFEYPDDFHRSYSYRTLPHGGNVTSIYRQAARFPTMDRKVDLMISKIGRTQISRRKLKESIHSLLNYRKIYY